MANLPNRTVLPIIPLERDTVLLPGVTLRIPVRNRRDIPALLSAIYKTASTPRPLLDSLMVGCLPLCSPLLSHEGQQLLEDSERRTRNLAERLTNDPSDVKAEDLFVYGVVAKISGVIGRKPGELSLVVEGTRRFRAERFTQFKPYTECEVIYLGEDIVDPADMDVQALFQQLKRLSRELLTFVRLSSLLPQSSTTLSPILARKLELFIGKKEFSEAGILADFMVNVVDTTLEERLRVLAATDVRDRLERVNDILQRQVNGIKGDVKITSWGTPLNPPSGFDITNLPMEQREALLRRRGLNIGPGPISSGLSGPGGQDDGNSELEELKKKLDDANLPFEAQKVADKELNRLRKMNPAQAEYGVCRTYLEMISEVPWSNFTEDRLGLETLNRARKQLDEDHYGLAKIKKRLLEYLAVLKLKQGLNVELDAQIQGIMEQSSIQHDPNKASEPPKDDIESRETKLQTLRSKRAVDKSPILLLVGPPGVGKTSLAKSVATALGRKFHRISLGGVRDEAEIRGHRRTYVAAMPGLIVKGLQKVSVSNPVFLLDEIDKVGGSNFHGDPSAAMLEVLDPEQNHTFMDHYLNIPLDLSRVLFIATANTLESIPLPLLDRMETISLSGYTTVEKRHIATRHLVPKQISTNGLEGGQVQLSDEVLDTIINAYTRESGVRNLEREIGSVCRYKAVQYADAKDADTIVQYNPFVSLADLEEILGHERFDEELAEKESTPGVVTGLVAYSYGGQGSILFIEVAAMPGTGNVQLTGKLGEVLRESVHVALTWVKAHALDLGLTEDAREDIMASRAIHVHCPAGAIPKDGPSAGLAHTVALVSLFSGRCVGPTVAMTGEVSLRGRVMPVGGIKEKLIGALRAGVKMVLLPKGNAKDVKDLPQEVKEGLDIVHVNHIWEALKTIWPDVQFRGDRNWNGYESRL